MLKVGALVGLATLTLTACELELPFGNNNDDAAVVDVATPTPTPNEIPDFYERVEEPAAPIMDMVGTWAWEGNSAWVWVFEAGGVGSNSEVPELTWELDGDHLTVTTGVPTWPVQYWTVEPVENGFTLHSLQTDEVYTYHRVGAPEAYVGAGGHDVLGADEVEGGMISGTRDNPIAIGETFTAYDRDGEPWRITVNSINLDGAEDVIASTNGINNIGDLEAAMRFDTPGQYRLVITNLTMQYAGESTEGVRPPTTGVTNMISANGQERSGSAIVRSSGGNLGSAAHAVSNNGFHAAGSDAFTADSVIFFPTSHIDDAYLRVNIGGFNGDNFYLSIG